MNIHTYDNYLTKEIWKRRACFYQNHLHSTKLLILFYTTLILRIAIDIILLRSPNFTDYWDYTSPLCLIDPYDNYARHNTYINILNGYDQWKCDQRSRNFVFSKVININPIQDGLFWGCSQIRRGGKAPLPKICHTYLAIMKLGHSYSLSKEDPKNILMTWQTPWVLPTLAFFHQKSANFAISRNRDIDCILIHNFYLF